jgi:hypothetical protein
MALTPERRAEMLAKVMKKPKAPEPKPEPVAKVVAEGGRIIRDVAVRVSPDDRNYQPSSGGFVRIDMVEYERQRGIAEADKARERVRRRELDPLGYGHWGVWED